MPGRLILAVFMTLIGLAPTLAAPTLAAPVTVKLGTMAPEGSVWHDALLEVRQDWRRISNGEVELRIYPGGVLGDEVEMVRKLQRRGLDAVAITGAGLPRLEPSFDVLNIPLLFETYDQFDYVRANIVPELEKRLEQRRFKVLNWSDSGWVYFFTKSPVRTPDDLKALRLWTSAGWPEAEKLYAQFGFNVVPLAATDMLTALQTGLIEAIDVPPLFALLDRSYQATGYMTDLGWAPLNAATVISLRAWRRIPERYHNALLESIRKVARDTRLEFRRSAEQAVTEMKARGLKVITLDAATEAQWRREARTAYPALRESIGLPALFDEVLRLAEEYKNDNPDSFSSGKASQP
ncbi:MAG: TRAP transporter substrate-binding protein DctP [Kiloniellales bacterium]|nr:TRAP transporter substrate-binding protein DctP [Kiloniellales bacterium]